MYLGGVLFFQGTNRCNNNSSYNKNDDDDDDNDNDNKKSQVRSIFIQIYIQTDLQHEIER